MISMNFFYKEIYYYIGIRLYRVVFRNKKRKYILVLVYKIILRRKKILRVN